MSVKNNKIHSAFKLKETAYEGISYVYPTWDQMGLLNFYLAKQIIQSGSTFDRIIALARGGWTWARDLSDALQVPELSSVRIVSYTGVNESSEPLITQKLTDSIKGEKVLLFDEVVDSGKSFTKALEHLKDGAPREIQTAALCYKPRSIIKPDFFAFSTEAWVVFPHEIREFVKSTIERWGKTDLSMPEMEKRFVKMGIPQEQVKFYCSLSS